MIPKNERQTPVKELSWMERMQLKLESFRETEAAGNPNRIMQETTAYLEKQMTTVGTNMRKFCTEFMKEMLLPDASQKFEGSQVETLQVEQGQSNGLLSGSDKPIKPAKVTELSEASVFTPETSLSGSPLDDTPLDHTLDVGHDPVASRESLSSEEAAKPASLENSTVLPMVSEQFLQQSLSEGVGDQHAHWFVSEEYRMTRFRKSTSASSLQKCDGLDRTPSSDSLHDWELV